MLYMWPVAIFSVAEGYISVKRLQAFLLTSDEKLSSKCINGERNEAAGSTKRRYVVNAAETVAKTIVKSKESYANLSRRTVNVNAQIKGIHFENASASWRRDGGAAGIHEVTLRIAQNELCAIVGQVGAGKSTLLQVILGELDVDSGLLSVNGTVSYAAQEAWIFEGSLRSNIVFVEEFDEKRYRDVVKVCALERDFKLFASGDATVVGERGINLSGGQKARVNLARAVYKRADIYLLDDPLSAVDAHVGKHIFKEAIQGFLSDKICVLITHQLQYLVEVKHVVMFNQHRIEAQGTHEELRERYFDSSLIHTTDVSAVIDTNLKTEVSIQI